MHYIILSAHNRTHVSSLRCDPVMYTARPVLEHVLSSIKADLAATACATHARSGPLPRLYGPIGDIVYRQVAIQEGTWALKNTICIAENWLVFWFVLSQAPRQKAHPLCPIARGPSKGETLGATRVYSGTPLSKGTAACKMEPKRRVP